MIDAHVHLIGSGSSGSGCWFHPHGVQNALTPALLHEVGLTWTDVRGDFDRLYVERLLDYVRGSGLARVLLLAQEDVYGDDGKRIPDKAAFYVPNDYVLGLARRHPEFVPAVSIHPARPDALEELEHCLEGGAAVMKCLPNCQNIDPRLRKYRRFWERMAEAGLPLLSHTGGEKVLPVVRADLADPRVLAAPLEIGVTVVAAHCGTSAGPVGTDYFPVFADMLRRYPRLYGDNSAISFPGKFRHLPRMLEQGTVERLIHGSDFPVPVQPLWAWLDGEIPLRDFLRLRRIGNPLARDIALKRALGFPDAVFHRITTVWRAPKTEPKALVVQSSGS